MLLVSGWSSAAENNVTLTPIFEHVIMIIWQNQSFTTHGDTACLMNSTADNF